jgi:hypothetical protein
MNDITPIPTPAPAPATTPAEPVLTGDLTAREAAVMIGWERENLAKGKISPEEATKRFDQLGATPEQRAGDTRTPAEVELDRASPPAKPGDYLIRWKDPLDPTPMSQQDRQADATARGWLADAGFPREIGNSLINRIRQVTQETKGMTESELHAYRLTELAKLQHVHRDKLPERLAAADDMIDELESQRPGLFNLLGLHGIGKSAMVWQLLINHAPIFHARNKARQR